MPERPYHQYAALFGIFWCLVYLAFQVTGIYAGDSGDLVTAAVTGGVPHPPGYPLYTFLGYLVSRIPVGTPVWRVTLLSSIPHAATVAVVFLSVVRLTGSVWSAAIGATLLAGNYLFFLYAVTPEVFALHDLFLSLLLYAGIRMAGSSRYVSPLTVAFVSFLWGLSVSHHHIMAFLVPAYGYLLYVRRQALLAYARIGRAALPLLGLVIGLLPYLYAPLATMGVSPIIWSRPDTLLRFFRLITRADYGTFVSGPNYGVTVTSRLLQIQAAASLTLFDFTVIGYLLAGAGLVYLFRKRRHEAIFLGTAWVFMGPVFTFYASFPLLTRFTIGTYERFLLPSYIVWTLLSGVGVQALITLATRLGLRRQGLRPIILSGVTVLMIYPLILGFMTVWRLWGIRTDRTADRLGADILATTERDSILLLKNDTPLFITQYVRYAARVRPDVILFHTNRLDNPDYLVSMRRLFPHVYFPETGNVSFYRDFLTENMKTHAVYSNTPLPVVDSGWVQNGLLYRAVPLSEMPGEDAIVDRNTTLFASYQDPRSGILGRYNHLMLSDIVDVYTRSRMDFGKYLLRISRIEDAGNAFAAALSLSPSEPSDPEFYLALTYLASDNCTEVPGMIDRIGQNPMTERIAVLYLKIQHARSCLHDEGLSESYYREYLEERSGDYLPLE